MNRGAQDGRPAAIPDHPGRPWQATATGATEEPRRQTAG
jgi:hypothetical protein